MEITKDVKVKSHQGGVITLKDANGSLHITINMSSSELRSVYFGNEGKAKVTVELNEAAPAPPVSHAKR